MQHTQAHNAHTYTTQRTTKGEVCCNITPMMIIDIYDRSHYIIVIIKLFPVGCSLCGKCCMWLVFVATGYSLSSAVMHNLVLPSIIHRYLTKLYCMTTEAKLPKQQHSHLKSSRLPLDRDSYHHHHHHIRLFMTDHYAETKVKARKQIYFTFLHVRQTVVVYVLTVLIALISKHRYSLLLCIL